MKLYPALALLCTGFSLAQSPPPNPPDAPPRPEGAPPAGEPGKRPFVDMMRQRFNGKDGKDGKGGMDQLGEEDRKRLRAVMEKVWNDPEVKTARDGAADAAKKYRDVMHEAALKADPSLAPILEKIKANMERMPMGGGPGFPSGQPGQQPNQPGQPGPGAGPQGPPNGPNAGPGGNGGNGGPGGPGAGEPGNQRQGFRGDAARPFGIDPAEFQKLPEEQRGRLREAFEKIMQNPEVKAAREATEKAEGEGKRDAFRKMRDAIKTVAEKEYPELAKLVEGLRGQGNGPGNGPGQGPGNGRGRGEGRPPQQEPAPGAPPPGGAAPPPDSPGAPENTPPK